MKYFHIIPADKQAAGYSGLTVGYQYTDKEAGKMVLSFARASVNDQFTKKKSRLICEGRMRKGKCIVTTKPQDKELYAFLLEQADHHNATVVAARTQKHGKIA